MHRALARGASPAAFARTPERGRSLHAGRSAADRGGTAAILTQYASLDGEEDAMSIFGKIKDAIFGAAKAKEAAPVGADGASSPATPASTLTAPPASPAQASPAAGTASVSAAPMSQVDIEGVLTQRAAENKQKLDWRRVRSLI